MSAAPAVSDVTSRRDGWLLAAQALGWALVGALACASVMILEPNLVEEGLVVHVAQRLAHGEHLYRDIVFFSGPLAFELLGLLFRLFGDDIMVGRYAAVAIHGINAGVAFLLLRRGGTGPLAHAGAAGVAALPLVLFPFFSMFYYTPLALSLTLWASYAALRGLDSTRAAFVAGLCVAAVALCKQTLGAALAAALLAALVACAPRAARLARARSFVLGGALLALLTVGFYAARGDFAELWRFMVTVPLSLGDTFSSRYMNLWPLGQLAPEISAQKVMYFPNLYFLQYGVYVPMNVPIVLLTQLLYATPFLALGATALARLSGPLPAAAWINAAQLAAMTTNLFPRSDWGHLVFALPAAGLQLLLLASSPLARAPRLRVALTLALLATFGFYGQRNHEWLHAEAGPPGWGPRIPLRPVSLVHKLVTVPRVIKYIRDRVRPGDPIFVARAEPLLYYATDTTNPTPYGGVLQALQSEQEEAILAALPSVRFVVMSDQDAPMWAYYASELPRVQKYLERYFRIPRSFPRDGWIQVLERGDDAGESWLDLIDAAGEGQGRAWLLDGEHAERPITEAEVPPRLVSCHNRRALPIRLGEWGGGMDFHFRVPPGARFEAGVGYRNMVSLDDLHRHPRGTHQVVYVGVDGGAFEKVGEQRVSDTPNEGWRWTDVHADLSRFAGREITLRLASETDQPTGKNDLTWWGSPRIVAGAVPPPAETAQAEAPASPPAEEAPAPAPAAPKPGVCPQLYAPVCGKDGKTFPNRCEAEHAGAQISHDGACDAPPAPPAPLLPHGGNRPR